MSAPVAESSFQAAWQAAMRPAAKATVRIRQLAMGRGRRCRMGIVRIVRGSWRRLNFQFCSLRMVSKFERRRIILAAHAGRMVHRELKEGK